MDTYYTYKIENAHTYDQAGKRLLVTKLRLSDAVITQIKSQEKDGYSSLQIGLGAKHKANKALIGHTKTLDVTPKVLREIILSQDSDKKIGDTLSITDIFKVGDMISAHAVSKGRGFAGVIKRWNFHGGPKTHGQSDRHRAPGSIGQGTTPGRVWKGKKMAGRYGSKMNCVRGGQIVKIDTDNKELWITGTVPGPKGGFVKIKKMNEGKFKGLWNQSTDKSEK